MSNKGTGTVLPVSNNEPRITGGVGHVNDGGTIKSGINIGGGKVQTWDGKIHG